MENDIVLYYQPKINLHTKKIESAEALIRVKNREGNFISTKEFIQLSKQNNELLDIDRWVFKQLVEDSRYISMMGRDNINISFNISTNSLLEDDFLQNLSDIFNYTTDFNSNFEIELTEYSKIKEIEKSVKIMNQLKNMGFKLSLDDFGSGYASFSNLKNFPIDSIEIDKLFIDEILKDDKTTKIVESIIYLAKKLSLKVVAKGVEDVEQVEWLYKNGCDEVQGYYYSKALPISQFVKFVKAVNQRENENSFIVWSDKYSIGNYAFDSQHMIIAGILNKIYKELKENKNLSDIRDYFDLLDRYIEIHFDTEERYM
jgi:EAL domain-containing protein (putative c-di-GMP-specific phosphodiesterase class I)